MQFLLVIAWLAALVVLYFVTDYMERKAAMRGTHRKPLKTTEEKALRLFFLFVLLFPACYAFPWVFVPLTLLYLPTYIDNTEKTGLRASKWLKTWRGWKFFKWYFTLSVEPTAGLLNPKQQYIFAMHPHGFLPFGTMVNLLSNVSNAEEKVLNGVKVRTLAASFCFYVPAYRDLLLAGGVIDAARYNARRALDDGYSLALVPGGATEALYANPGTHIVVLSYRLGFVKLAIETGAHLVPCYSFGETDTYRQLSDKIPWVRPLQLKWQRIFGFSLPLVTFLLPMRAKIATVFGKPIPVTRIEKPTDEQVQKVLDVYIEALKKLFNEQAPKFIADPKQRKLEIL